MLDKLTRLWDAYSDTILAVGYNLLLSVGVLLACAIVARWVARTIRTANSRHQRLDATLLPIISTTASYLVYVIACVIVLDIFGVNTASIIALLGAAGLAVGFALKDTLSNIAAGIMLLFLRPFNAGDSVACGGISGTVDEINLFTTHFTTGDGLFVSVPNSSLWGGSITNYTRNGKRRLDVAVGIDYADSIDAGFAVLRGIAASEPRFLPDPAPAVLVTALADSSVNLTLRGWTSVADFGQAQCDLNKRVKEEIEKAGLSIPFPQRGVHIVRDAH